ncbi:hypothetical protein BHE74_00054464 [Ensete ventricosum]|nr:hypothetical protein BHE74_00054464 [Ensete ventricosum]
MRGSRGLSGELDRLASIGCPVSLTNRPPRTDSWRPALSTRIDDDKHPTRVARRLLRPSPSDSRPEKEFVALQKYAKREPALVVSAPVCVQIFRFAPPPEPSPK